MSKIYENIAATLDGADENLTKLLSEYERSLSNKTVSAKATDLTHQICMQLRSALDRTAYRYWNLKIAPSLPPEDQGKAKSTIYFPAGGTKESLDSTLGNWRWKSVKNQHQPLYNYLTSIQPTAQNKWLTVLFDLAVQGKHIDLTPQKRTEERRITVSNQAGTAVSWNTAAVKPASGPGVQIHIAGALFDPATQRIVPTQGVTEKVDTWVSFLIEGHNMNAAGFCKKACRETRKIIQEMTDQFGLS